MELRHLRYFAAVASHRSFVRGAKALNVSQPPLSRQIRDLEEEIGTPLFEREGRGTVLTEAGDYLQGEVQRLLENIEVICRNARLIGEKNTNEIKIGCVNFLLSSILPQFFMKAHQQFPQMRFIIKEMPTAAQREAILQGTVDFGFVRYRASDAGLVFEPLTVESLVIIYPEGACREQDPRACMASLARLPFIAISKAAAPRLAERITTACLNFGPVPSSGYETNDAFSIVKFVAAGLGWSIVPDLTYRAAMVQGLDSMTLPNTDIDLGLCYREGPIAEANRQFIDFIKIYFDTLNRQ